MSFGVAEEPWPIRGERLTGVTIEHTPAAPAAQPHAQNADLRLAAGFFFMAGFFTMRAGLAAGFFTRRAVLAAGFLLTAGMTLDFAISFELAAGFFKTRFWLRKPPSDISRLLISFRRWSAMTILRCFSSWKNFRSVGAS